MSVATSETVVYDVIARNDGTASANSVTLIEQVPAGTVFDGSASDPGWGCVDGDPAMTRCLRTVGLLGPGEVRSFPFAVRLPATIPAGFEEVENTVTSGQEIEDQTPQNNTATDTTPVDAAPDLRLVVSDGGVSVTAGEVITYTFDLTNAGDQDTEGVEVRATVPLQTSFVAAGSDPGWSCAGSSGGSECVFLVGGLAAGESVPSFVLEVFTDDTLPAGVEEIVLSTSVMDDGVSGPDANPADNVATETTPIDGVPDLAVVKDDGGVTASPGELIHYTLQAFNVGTQGATGVELLEVIPQDTRFVPTESDPRWSCTGTTPQSSCLLSLPSLPADGAPVAVAFALRVDVTVPAGVEVILNAAAIGDDLANGLDPDPSNNVDEVVTPLIAAPDLVLAKDDGGGTVMPGELLSYVLTVENSGTQGATGVVLEETVPSSTTFEAGASDPAWICSTSTPGSACVLELDELPAGGVEAFVFAVRLDATVPADLVEIPNAATVLDDGTNGADPDPANNQASTVTPVDAVVILDVAKSVSVETVDAGELLSYTISIANAGNQDALGVTLLETVPEYTSFEESSDPAWSCSRTVTGPACSLDVGPLPAGEPALIYTFTVRLDAVLPAGFEEIENTVLATDSAGHQDAATLFVPLGPETLPELQLAKEADLVEVDAGDRLTYTLSLENTGTLGASAVVLFETVPDNTTFSPEGSDPSWICSGSVPGASCELLVGILPAGEPARSFAFAVDVTEPLPAGVAEILNSALVTDDAGHSAEATAVTPIAATTAPDLVVLKDDRGVVANPGDLVTYTVTLQNVGAQDASGVLVTDVLSPHTSFVRSGSDPQWACGETTCTLFLALLSAGNPPQSLDLTVRVVSPLPSGVVELVNTVMIMDDGTSGEDPNTSNNLATAVTPVERPDEVVSIVATKSDTVVDPSVYGLEGGIVIEYLVVVENLGTVAVPQLRFEPEADPATVYVEGSAVTSSGTVLEGEGSFEVDFGEILPGDVRELLFAVHLEAPTPPFLTQVECQGFLTSPVMPPVLTDDPETPEALDPTVTILEEVPGEPVDIPTLSRVGLFGLLLGLVSVAMVQLRRRRCY